MSSTIRRRGFLAAVVAVAVLLRVSANLFDPLWLDEAWRARKILETGSPWSLSAVWQPNPTLLLPSEWVIGKLTLALFDRPEVALRLPPFLIGILLIPAAFMTATRLGGPLAGAVAAVLFAFSPGFVLHAREFKPYGLDCLLSLLLIGGARRLTIHSSRRDVLAYASLLGVTAASALPWVFVAPGCLAFILWRRPAAAQRGELLPLLASAMVFVFSLLTIVAPQGAFQTQASWKDFYIASLATSRYPAMLPLDIISLFSPIAPEVVVFTFLVLVPLISFRRRDGAVILLLIPLLLHLPADVLHLYPLGQRPSAYLFAILLLGFSYAAAGVADELRAVVGRRADWLAAALLALVAVSAASGSLLPNLRYARSWPPSYGRASIALLEDHAEPGDVLLMNSPAFYHVNLYGRSLATRVALDLDSRRSVEEHLVPDPDHPWFHVGLCRAARRLGTTRPTWLLSLWRVEPFDRLDSAAPDAEVWMRAETEALVRLPNGLAKRCDLDHSPGVTP